MLSPQRKPKYYKRPDGLYETIRTVNGKRIAFRGKTCAEVDRKLLAYQEDREAGRYFPEIVDEWGREKAAETKNGTMTAYKAPIARVRAYFEGVRSRAIRPLDVARYVRQMEQKGYAGSTIGLDLAVIRQVCSYAVLQGDIDVNPAAEVRKKQGLPKTERLPLTEEEERLVEEYRGPGYEIGLILLYTGCRRGELAALTWQDIDRERGEVHFTKKLDFSTCPPTLDDHLKNARRRDAPLFDVLADALPKHRIGLIMPGADGGHIRLHEFEKHWKAYREAVGLGEHVTPHCFRHSYATLCYEAGIDEKAAAAFLGDTEAVTRTVYQKLRDRHHKTSAEAVNAHLSQRLVERKKEA